MQYDTFYLVYCRSTGDIQILKLIQFTDQTMSSFAAIVNLYVKCESRNIISLVANHNYCYKNSHLY